MTVLAAVTILTLTSQYGDWDANKATWVIYQESRNQTDAYNPTGPYSGLMQVALSHGYTREQLENPEFNIKVGHDLYVQSGWSPWPVASQYPGKEQIMSRQGPGWCPFAQQVEGVTTFQSGGMERVGFCDHAAGGFYTTLQSAQFWNNAGVSTHFGISRKGEICQLVNIFATAFAQGRLGPVVIWPPYNTMGQYNPNLYLISTEHEDWEIVGGKSRAIPGSEWTQAEYDADLKLKKWCVQEVFEHSRADLLKFDLDSLAGHYMFDGVNRAECPGAFWRNSYRQMLFNDLRGVSTMEPTIEEIALAFASYIHFVRNGFNLADLSPRDKECLRFAGEKVPA